MKQIIIVILCLALSGCAVLEFVADVVREEEVREVRVININGVEYREVR